MAHIQPIVVKRTKNELPQAYRESQAQAEFIGLTIVRIIFILSLIALLPMILNYFFSV